MLRALNAVLAGAGLILCVATAGAAQGVQPGAAGKPRVDDSALRFYASQGNTARVAAEARRLSRAFPDWRIPNDLASAKPGREDEGPLWALFSEQKFDDLKIAIATREAAEPGWHPSDDLAAKVHQSVMRAAILHLAKMRDWRGIVQKVKAAGVAWAEGDAEALWVIGEAYARQNDCGEAYVVYRMVLSSHTDQAERIATIQHAIATIPIDYVEKLIAMGHTTAESRSEFDSIGIDITRARIAAFLHDETQVPIAAKDLVAFMAFVKDSEDSNQTGLVAWYAFKQGDYRQALEWFKLSISHGGDAMIAHGLAHSLRKLGMMREAEEVAYAWREPLVNNSILFIDLLEQDLTKERPPFIEPARMTRYAQVVMGSESGEGAQALAWYAYNTCQYPLALEWFQRAVAWMPKQATVYGYALTLQRLKKPKEFRDIVNRYDGLFPDVVALAFNDGRQTPPPPCEASIGTPSAPPRNAGGSTMGWPISSPRLNTNGSFAPTNPLTAYERARVPSPATSFANGTGGSDVLIKKTEFPASVPTENPLRFSALKTVALEEQNEPRASKSPLVARRVPGVGAMPYEHYGFSLMPGWDGTTEASRPIASDRPPAAGTLAALAQMIQTTPAAKDAALASEARAPTSQVSNPQIDLGSQPL